MLPPRPRPRSILRHPPLLWALLLAPGAQAATIGVEVTDAKGRPAVDAVVMLEPGSGRAPVKPLPQVDVSQATKQFNPEVTVVTVGTPVNFPNFDTVRHHVYSKSPAKVFDLKLYAGVPEKPVIFDKAGIAVLGCNIHDTMGAWIVVSDTPWYALSGRDGKARVDNVPPGSYTMRVWHPAMPLNMELPRLRVVVAGSDLQQALQLPVSAGP